jgi:plasmid stabilization system protein ParE
MPRGDKSKYTDKQERMADHIAEGYEGRGVSEKEAERRAWATVNKETGGGKKSGSGRGPSRQPCPVPKGRPDRRPSICLAFGRRAFRLGEEGGCDPQAQRRARASLSRRRLARCR